MNCIHCGNVLNDGARFCPYCGTQQDIAPNQSAYSAGQPFGTYSPYNGQVPFIPPGYMPQGVDENEIGTTKTLGLVALIVGIFIPLVGYVCGGIGLSKIGKLMSFAHPIQAEQLKKNRTLCILGIVIPAVVNILSFILVEWAVRGQISLQEKQLLRKPCSVYSQMGGKEKALKGILLCKIVPMKEKCLSTGRLQRWK